MQEFYSQGGSRKQQQNVPLEGFATAEYELQATQAKLDERKLPVSNNDAKEECAFPASDSFQQAFELHQQRDGTSSCTVFPYQGYDSFRQNGENAYHQVRPYLKEPLLVHKDHVVAGMFAVLLGMFGIHKFYLGYNTAAFIMLGAAILGGIFTFGLAIAVVWIIAIVEGGIYFTKTQSEFERDYVFNKREWF